jgi:hypothetical protein
MVNVMIPDATTVVGCSGLYRNVLEMGPKVKSFDPAQAAIIVRAPSTP